MHHPSTRLPAITQVLLEGINLEKAVNHGGHGEHGGKTRACVGLSNHPLGESEEKAKTQAFRRARRVRRG
jgi:hypothetical protein